MATHDLLVIFTGSYGQTHKIAEHIVDLARRHGFTAKCTRVEQARVMDLREEARAIIIAAPVYVGRHPKEVGELMRSRADVLSEMPIAFVSVSNSAGNGSLPAARDHAMALAKAFIAKLGLPKCRVLTAGGAFAYPSYGVLVRWVMKRIAKSTGGLTDTTRRHELTDWLALDDDVRPFLLALDEERPPTSSVEKRREQVPEPALHP